MIIILFSIIVICGVVFICWIDPSDGPGIG